MLREMLKENIERVQAGQDPIHGFTRDPNHPIINTNLDSGLAQSRADRAPEIKSGGIHTLVPLVSNPSNAAEKAGEGDVK